eukprot:Hpha_TRINITY_DN10551_c0_g1::TRINITY_DN10551_c0_g1_i1::g.31337::m.31337/K08869/ADCK, ABC1; aarF domain-containing kinase
MRRFVACRRVAVSLFALRPAPGIAVQFPRRASSEAPPPPPPPPHPPEPPSGDPTPPDADSRSGEGGHQGQGPHHQEFSREHEQLIEEFFALIGSAVGELPQLLVNFSGTQVPARLASAAQSTQEAASGFVAMLEALFDRVFSVFGIPPPRPHPASHPASTTVPNDEELETMSLPELFDLADRMGAPERHTWRDREDVLKALQQARETVGSTDLQREVRALREEVSELRRQQEHLVLLLRKRHAAEQHPNPPPHTPAPEGKAAAAPTTRPPAPAPLPPPTPKPAASVNAIKDSAVPSTAPGRAAKLAGLVTRLAWDAGAKRFFGRKGAEGGVLSDQGLDMLVERLCHMRGAALKLGQLLSIQDEAVIPPHVLQAFERVRDHAHSMPQRQLEETLSAELGKDWRGQVLGSLEMKPVAAASLGQVHKGTLPDGTEVAVKVQFPGVEESITSDVKNLHWLFTLGFMPKGLYADNILRELRTELLRECDYLGEADRQESHRDTLERDPDRKGLLSRIRIPQVRREASTRRVLTTDWCSGMPSDKLIGSDKKEEKNALGEQLFFLTLKETFVWRLMQTDPNYANFLWDDAQGTLSLIDFGAARSFSEEFSQQYLLVVDGAAKGDRDQIIEASRALGFLTGEECDEMLNAHCEATLAIGTPFGHRGVFEFGEFDLAARVRPHVQTMLKLRLTAPPKEVYSLHRRLSGLFLLLMKLGCRFDVRRLWIDILRSLDRSVLPADVHDKLNRVY